MGEKTDTMADVTRKIAREEDPMEREKAGSHDFSARAKQRDGDADGDDAGAGQTDDLHSTAPAAGMARHKTKARD